MIIETLIRKVYNSITNRKELHNMNNMKDFEEILRIIHAQTFLEICHACDILVFVYNQNEHSGVKDTFSDIINEYVRQYQLCL